MLFINAAEIVFEGLIRSAGCLALTYDDGPEPVLTRRVAEVLARHGVRATFFLLGRRAEAAPAVADALLDAGHELGCRSYEHLNAWKHWPRRGTSSGATRR